MTIFHCENWSAVFFGALLFTIPAYGLWQLVRDGRGSLRVPLGTPQDTIDAKRNGKRFRFYLALHAAVVGALAVLLTQNVIDRCGGF
jgi:hypothetical protein